MAPIYAWYDGRSVSIYRRHFIACQRAGGTRREDDFPAETQGRRVKRRENQEQGAGREQDSRVGSDGAAHSPMCSLRLSQRLCVSAGNQFSRWALTFQPHLSQPIPQRISRQPQQPRRLTLIPVGPPQRFLDDVLLVLIQTHSFRQEMRIVLRPWPRRALQLDVG